MFRDPHYALTRKSAGARRFVLRRHPEAKVVAYGWLTGRVHLVDHTARTKEQPDAIYLSKPFRTHSEVWLDAAKRIKEKEMATKKSSKKTVQPERIIYSLLPSVVEVMGTRRGRKLPSLRKVPMEVGRLTAQHGHVVSLMRVELASRYGTRPITTIALSVRNSRERNLLETLLLNVGVRTFKFMDENPDFYNTKGKVKTAICTEPVFKERVEPILGHLDLFAKGLQA